MTTKKMKFHILTLRQNSSTIDVLSISNSTHLGSGKSIKLWEMSKSQGEKDEG